MVAAALGLALPVAVALAPEAQAVTYINCNFSTSKTYTNPPSSLNYNWTTNIGCDHRWVHLEATTVFYYPPSPDVYCGVGSSNNYAQSLSYGGHCDRGSTRNKVGFAIDTGAGYGLANWQSYYCDPPGSSHYYQHCTAYTG